MILQSLWTLISFKNLGLKTYYSPPTVVSELCTLRLFSCIISVIESYVITRAVITTAITSVWMATQCCWNFTNMLLTTIALGYTTYYSSNCIVLFLSVFPWSNVTHIVLGTRANNCTFHCSWWYLHMHCVTAWEDLPSIGLCLKFSSAL